MISDANIKQLNEFVQKWAPDGEALDFVRDLEAVIAVSIYPYLNRWKLFRDD